MRGSNQSCVAPNRTLNIQRRRRCARGCGLKGRLRVQGDTSRWLKPPVDLKTKVPLWPGLAKSPGGFGQLNVSPCREDERVTIPQLRESSLAISICTCRPCHSLHKSPGSPPPFLLLLLPDREDNDHLLPKFAGRLV